MFDDTKQEPEHKSHFARYRQIITILAKCRLEEVLHYIGLQRLLHFRFILRGNPFRKMTYTKPGRMRMATSQPASLAGGIPERLDRMMRQLSGVKYKYAPMFQAWRNTSTTWRES